MEEWSRRARPSMMLLTTVRYGFASDGIAEGCKRLFHRRQHRPKLCQNTDDPDNQAEEHNFFHGCSPAKDVPGQGGVEAEPRFRFHTARSEPAKAEHNRAIFDPQ